jgi:exodeoxyribonuclease VII large subunit
VTSETGAVWHDIRDVLARRWPLARVVLSQCQVQGAGAPASIVRALAWVDRYAERCKRAGRADEAPTVTILARGGGSLEDLWSFNDEAVVRAIVGHSLPVVCGVGHETDVTLADFAADRRAPTPSAAAEIVVPDRTELAAVVAGETRRLQAVAERTVRAAAREAAAERRALDGLSPISQLAASRERAGLLLDRATRAVRARLGAATTGSERSAARLRPGIVVRVGGARASVDAAGAALGALGPEATLERGYAIVRRARDGRIVRDPVETPAGEGLSIRVARGEIPATVDRKARP